MKNITKENLIKFATDNAIIDDKLMKIEVDGIIYIYEASYYGKLDISRDHDDKPTLIGFVVNGNFYGIHYKYSEIDKDFNFEVNIFEDKFNTLYENYISQYTAENPAPITDKTDRDEWKTMEQKIEDYKENYMEENAIDSVFNTYVDVGKDKKNSNNCRDYNKIFVPMFMGYLKEGETILNKYIAENAERKAEAINYKILTNIELDKEIKRLTQDKIFMQRVELYGKLKGLDAKTVKITLDIDGTIFEGLKIDLSNLRRSLRYRDGEISDYHFTNNEQQKIKKAWTSEKQYFERKITISNIVKITYGKTTVYEK